jgi:hypothetical protein
VATFCPRRRCVDPSSHGPPSGDRDLGTSLRDRVWAPILRALEFVLEDRFGKEMTPTPGLLELILSEFQSALRENLKHVWEPKQGRPPKYGYVEQTEWTENEAARAKPLAAWHISSNVVRPASVKDPGPRKIDGMFYDLFRGWFYFPDDLSVVFINWETGPRFGRGFKHRIGQDTLGAYLLDRGASTWIS